MSDLATAARTVVERCVAVRPGENVLVVCDPDRVEIAKALHAAALEAGGDAIYAVLPPRPERGTEPPPTIAAAFAACDVFLAPCLPSLSHTKARKAASDRGARGATLPGAREEMFARLMSAEFDAMARRSVEVADLLTQADEAHFTCPKGSDMRFELGGRTAIPDTGELIERSAFGNLPSGEAFISPTGGSGVIVATSVGSFGFEFGDIRLTVDDARLTDVSAEGAGFAEYLDAYGPDGRHLAELGVGTNERARLTGNLLEDEKILGTVHVAFGASAGIGGTVNVPVHEDVVVTDPTLTIGGTTVVDAGRFVLS